jgi:hypothetical protein
MSEEKNLDDYCLNKETIEKNLKDIIEIFGFEIKDKGVELMGCYQCDGYNEKCDGYLPKKLKNTEFYP